MKRYNLINNALGWLCFVIAALTYILTLEPTASFWDCPEFILQGAKLEVGHPPGNPIFMLAARFMITLFGGSMSTAALAVNTMSALLSAGTILLLFWSMTHLIKRLIVSDDAKEVSTWQMLLIMGGGICAALAYTWSDTFWFSAVEGEVYAFSSFCTALVVWLMFKWENRADEPTSDRYLILIAYVIGVSIAVHLLNLLCIPALGLIYYYRKYKNINAVGSLIALGVSCVIVGAILYGLVPGFVQVAQWFELFFVNVCGLSFNMGVLIYAVLLVTVFILAIRGMYRKPDSSGSRLLFVAAIGLSGMPFIGHSALIGTLIILALLAYVFFFCKKVPARAFALVLISTFVIFVGYASYALLLIRASANTPMNQNAPDNVFALASYLNREQYGDRPLFKGPVFTEMLEEEEYPQGSGNYFVAVDENGFPMTRPAESYLRDENGSVFNEPTRSYTKQVKSSPDEPDKYVDAIERPNYRSIPDLDMFFTRIYSPDAGHVQGYKAWAGYTNPDIYSIPAQLREKWAAQGYAPKMEILPYFSHMQNAVTNVYAATGAPAMERSVWKPGFDVNLRYFINYQLNHMYWRYFMWNFAGRQNDIQSNGEPQYGNWISGIPFIDNARLGDQSTLPDEYGKNNKGHNVFYMLPLLLGVIGLLFQSLYRHRTNPERGIQQFWVVFFLFFMTGIAIVLYLNQTPGQPRERDYAFAGSFYAFAMWIGMGVPAIAIMLRNLLDKKGDNKAAKTAATAVALVAAVGIPAQMVSQTWDDHDRSGRYTARDFGFNYLSSLDPNAIIFTNGDNDTFPLWYAQEVENFRPDVRVVNLSYLTTDWYADQMQHPTSAAKAIDMLAKPSNYAYENLAYSLIIPEGKDSITAEEALKGLYSSGKGRYGVPEMHASVVRMPYDRASALKRYSSGNDSIDARYLSPYLSEVITDLGGRGSGLNQSRVLSLDIINRSLAGNWERPVYFATTVPTSYYLGLSPYLSATGMAYEVTPFKDATYNPTAEKAYVNILTKFRWGGLDAKGAEKLYLDETVRRMVSSMRSGIFTIVENLMLTPELPAGKAAREAAKAQGLPEPKTHADMARQLMQTMEAKMPVKVAPYDGMLALYIARMYMDLYGETGNKADLAAAKELALAEANRYAQLVKYVSSLDATNQGLIGRSDRYSLQYLGEALALYNRAEILEKDPTLYTDPARRAELDALLNTSFENDLRTAPIVYMQSFTPEQLEAEAAQLDSAQQETIRAAAAFMRAAQRAGVDRMALINSLMSKYGFDANAWNRVI